MDLPHSPAEFHVDLGIARLLLQSQHPALLTGDLTLVGEGWDNVTYRIGASHAMRIPRRELAVPLLLNERRWLPRLAEGLPLTVPVPLAAGEPSGLFPWPWNVVPWIEGVTADRRSLSDSDAELLARTLRRLHVPAPMDAPPNPFRGVPLVERRAAIEERLARLGLTRLRPLWEEALGVDPSLRRVWLHGDLHPRNVILQSGALAALIDWGDVTGGDPATDLACAWTLLDAGPRSSFRRVYSPTDGEWSRAAGWALHFGSALLDSGDHAHTAIGQLVLDRLEAEL